MSAVSSVSELLSATEQRGDRSDRDDVYVLFWGNVREDTGQSWCPDCVRAEPVIDKVFRDVKPGLLIRCNVGDRETWRDPKNEFRVHPQTQVSGVPTLMRWGKPEKPEKLGPDECDKEDLVRKFVGQ